MKQKLRALLLKGLPYFPRLRKFLLSIFPSNLSLNRNMLEENYLESYIRYYYDPASIKEKKFYNIGAGSQRSKYPIWCYIDMKESLYDKKGVDLYHNLESLEPLPLDDNTAEVVFNSFVIEHISIAATKNLCQEAFRVLKPGGVFHSKVHSYEYGYRLWKKGLISLKLPFDGRESAKEINEFIRRHKGRIKAFFSPSKGYVLQSIKNPAQEISYSPADMFLLHNATTAYERIHSQGLDSEKALAGIGDRPIGDFFEILRQQYVDQRTRQPHQHNADYFSQENLFAYIKGLGFSEVYFTQPYQSCSPALWEEALNPIHKGFVFAIEAVK